MKTIEITVANENIDEFNAKFTEINEKFAKKGFPLLVSTEHEFNDEINGSREYIRDNRTHFRFFTISSSWEGMNIADTPCDFQGVVNFVDMNDLNSRIVTCEDENVGNILRSEKLCCDACKKNITRGKYIAFLKRGMDVSRENMIILGRNCAKDYFPFDIEGYFSSLEFVFHDFMIYGGDPDEVCRRHRETYISFDEVAFITGKVTNNFTVYHKADDNMYPPTRQDFMMYKSDSTDKFGHHFSDDYKNVEVMGLDEIKKMIIDAYLDPVATEFNRNIHSVMFDSENNIRDFINMKYLGIAIYAFVGARRFMDKQKSKEVEHESDKKSEWVGNVGDKFEKEFIFIKSMWFESQFGYNAFHFFKDEDGNVYKWSTTKELRKDFDHIAYESGRSYEDCCEAYESGDKIKLKGTVKAHSEYNGVKQTVITRCKVI